MSTILLEKPVEAAIIEAFSLDSGNSGGDLIDTNYCSPTPNNSCGFSITPNKWQSCANGVVTTLGSSTYVVTWQNITINDSSKLTSGTLIP
jgi:hypothetical protein